MTTEKRPSKSANTSTHDVDHGHDNRVDELSEERATHQEAPVMPWQRPSSLDAPPPREGMVQRWIRMTIRGVDDPRNMSRKMREGWNPRPASSIPDTFKHMNSRQAAQDGVFAVDDLVLCEMPESVYSQRASYYAQQTHRQMQAVEHDLEKSQVSGHPIHREHRSAADTSQGRRVAAADDD